jgi:hypothetical protein
MVAIAIGLFREEPVYRMACDGAGNLRGKPVGPLAQRQAARKPIFRRRRFNRFSDGSEGRCLASNDVIQTPRKKFLPADLTEAARPRTIL